VVLSDDLVADPEGMLRALCAELDLPFQPQVPPAASAASLRAQLRLGDKY
jgi:hypothetical protein